MLLLPTALAFPPLFRLDDPIELQGLPSCATEADARYQPGTYLPTYLPTSLFPLPLPQLTTPQALDFDKDGTYNTAAIDARGRLNPGSSHCTLASPLRDPRLLAQANVYARSRCNTSHNGSNNGSRWCAHVYAYYFTADVAEPLLCTRGHRHDWEHVVVWTRDDEPRYVAASAHGRYNVREAGRVLWLEGKGGGGGGMHPKIVYHKDGLSTHAFRFGREDDDRDVENHTGRWVRSALVSWEEGFRDAAVRETLAAAKWGAASFGLRDGKFRRLLKKAKGGRRKDIPMDVDVDDEISPGESPTCARCSGGSSTLSCETQMRCSL